MITSTHNTDNISVAESTRRAWEEEDARLARQHDLAVRQLELSYLKQDQNWGSLIKIPMTIILLPVYIVMAFGFCFAMLRKYKLPQSYWDLFK
ncbi:MAG TPA: hypothetical protein VGF75_07145 [Candidatus Saccharimonadales bacterium]